MKTFALTGVAGYIAHKHLEAIRALGVFLVEAYDQHDSVGILDRYFPKTVFFTEYSTFIQFLKKQEQIDYLVVCSPNDVHFQQIADGFSIGAQVICEKPLVLTTNDVAQLKILEQKYQKRVFTLLQLRLHPAFKAMQKRIEEQSISDVQVIYHTPRGPWYQASWKGNVLRSGGIAFNIGIHLFDLCLQLFGKVEQIDIDFKSNQRIQGTLRFKQNKVKFDLSIETASGLPERLFSIGSEDFDLSSGFQELHVESYRKIIENQGFGIEVVTDSIALCETIQQVQNTIADL